MLGDGKDDGGHPGDGLPVIKSKYVFWPVKLVFVDGFVARLVIDCCFVYFNEHELIN